MALFENEKYCMEIDKNHSNYYIKTNIYDERINFYVTSCANQKLDSNTFILI